MIARVDEQAKAVVAEIRGLGRHTVLIEGSVFERPHARSIVKRAVRDLDASTYSSATRRFSDVPIPRI